MKTFLIVLATLATIGSASAADLGKGDKDQSPIFVDAPSKVSWTGVYIGGRAGYGNANHDLTVEAYDNDPEEGDPATFGLFGIDGKNSPGFVGGGQLGADYQRGALVVGVFGSYDFANMETNATFFDETDTIIEKGDEWSVGARGGFLINPRTLIYLLAAYTETEYTFAGIGTDGGDKDVTFSGITAGGGIEVALSGNVFVGLEGTHTFYGEENLWDTCTDGPCGGGLREVDDLGETKVMGTLKIKLNANPGDLF